MSFAFVRNQFCLGKGDKEIVIWQLVTCWFMGISVHFGMAEVLCWVAGFRVLLLAWRMLGGGIQELLVNAFSPLEKQTLRCAVGLKACAVNVAYLLCWLAWKKQSHCWAWKDVFSKRDLTGSRQGCCQFSGFSCGCLLEQGLFPGFCHGWEALHVVHVLFLMSL